MYIHPDSCRQQIFGIKGCMHGKVPEKEVVFMKTGTHFAVKNAGPSADLTREVFHDSLALTGTEISINRLKAGESIPFIHSHKRNEEVYIFIKGKGMAYIDGEKIPVTEGDFMRIDPEGKRCFKADDSTDLTYICIQAERNSLVQHTKEDGHIIKESLTW